MLRYGSSVADADRQSNTTGIAITTKRLGDKVSPTLSGKPDS